MPNKKSYCIIIFSSIILLIILYLSLYFYFYYIDFSLHINNYEKSIILRTQHNKLINSKLSTNLNLYYINLDTSLDRKERFLKRLPEYIIPTRITAIMPNTLPKLQSSISCILNNNKILSCSVSHLKAIHKAFHDNNNIAMIAEDDMIILKNINWYYLDKLAPLDWEIIQLHTCCLLKSTKSYNPIYKYNNSNTLFIKAFHNMIGSAACYLINRKGMLKLLKRYIPNYLDPNWDNIKLINFSYHKFACEADHILFYNVNRYVCTKILIDVDGIDSTLHPSHLKLHKITKDYITNSLI